MGNIKNFNFNKLDLKLSNNDYWDMFLSADGGPSLPCSGATIGDCNVVFFDFNNPSIYSTGTTSADTIYSLVHWTGATNTGHTIDTVGFTGIDNGFITFDKISGDTTNSALLNALTGSSLSIPSDDYRMMLTRVTGTTGNFEYPIDIVGTTKTFAYLNGGFYQGFYKIDGTTYELLPNRVNHAWSAEFLVNLADSNVNFSGQTLNDLYPENKGIFFYMGTRAENKFWNTFEGNSTGCTSGCTVPSGCTDTVNEWCTIPKETDISLKGPYDVLIPLNPPLINIDVVTNPFLIYGRGDGNTYCGESTDGLGSETVSTYSGGGQVVVTHSQVVTNKTNPFLVYGRGNGNTYCGESTDGLGDETVSTFTGFTKDQDTLDYNLDIIDNAFAFRITDDGRIGYRSLTVTGDCVTTDNGLKHVSGITIEEKYSDAGIIQPEEWTYIAVRFVMPYLDDCDLKIASKRKGKLMFYVNAKLKFVVDEVDEFIGRRLNDSSLKQVGVPFNFSLGGGSLGLLESQTFDGLDMADRGLPIEKNFGGTFVGGISQFKFNICDLLFCDIEYNYKKIKDYLENTNNNISPIVDGIYYGKLINTSVDLTNIGNLTFKTTHSAVNSYVSFMGNTNAFCYILIPSTFAQPSNLKNSSSGCLSFEVPYINMPDITISDSNGNEITYKVYRTFYKTNGDLDIWMCN